MDANTPIWQLTVGQFQQLLAEMKQPEQPKQEKIYVYGLKGIAGLLGCSLRTAGKIKASGKLDKAIYQDGRTIIVDADMALELIKL